MVPKGCACLAQAQMPRGQEGAWRGRCTEGWRRPHLRPKSAIRARSRPCPADLSSTLPGCSPRKERRGSPSAGATGGETLPYLPAKRTSGQTRVQTAHGAVQPGRMLYIDTHRRVAVCVCAARWRYGPAAEQGRRGRAQHPRCCRAEPQAFSCLEIAMHLEQEQRNEKAFRNTDEATAAAGSACQGRTLKRLHLCPPPPPPRAPPPPPSYTHTRARARAHPRTHAHTSPPPRHSPAGRTTLASCR